MKFSKEIVIDAPAEKVWDILGYKFADVGIWARSISSSTVNHSASKVNNSPVGGRVCDTSIGHINEKFLEYSDENMTFSFDGEITSKMFTTVVSTNSVIAIDENTSKVVVTPSIELKFLGKLIYPLIKMSLNKTVNEVLIDLKYYAENDKPSPEKLATKK